jgi:hypothetical protein
MLNKDNMFSTQDDLLAGMTYQELIDTVCCNETWKDEIRVKKVFQEILEKKIQDAKALLNQNMGKIINKLYED